MLKAVTQVLGLGVSLAAMMEPMHADGPLPCWPTCAPADPNNETEQCVQLYGGGWYYCGPAGPGYIWCCYV